MTAEPAFEGWAILELMGHRKRPGYVKEVEIAGGKMLRIDIHGATEGENESVVTEFYGCAAVYCLRPVAEEIARDVARHVDLRPIRPVEYRPAPQLPSAVDYDEDDDDIF